jgi:tetratricopeptide (TPR) repeat protein
MLPPALMLATKNVRSEDGERKIENGIVRRDAVFHLLSSICHLRFLLFLALVLALAGCSPSGPRALLKGKKQLERGNYDAAVAQLKIATSLLNSNAQAWNYLGVACQHAGQPAEAAAAYQRALAHDRDLMEAHYNLGCLWLEQNKPDAAASEFVAYTLRRSKAPEGWLKLGLAQLQAHDVAAAEKSFSTALYLSPDNAEALNGLGLARVERGRPTEAAQFFTAATKGSPDYAPAWLNLGTVALQHLHDTTLALQTYRAYLALKPRPADWDAVNVLVNSLESPAKTIAVIETPAPAPESRTFSTTGATRPTTLQRTQTVARASTVPPRQAATPTPTVKVPPEPAIFGAPAVVTPSEPSTNRTSTFSRLNPLNWFRSAAPETNQPINQPMVVTSSPPPVVRSPRVGITPLAPVSPVPSAPAVAAPKPAPVVAPKPARVVQPAVPMYPRYGYQLPPRPKAGDRRMAGNAFTQAREFEQASRWQEALQAYREATDQDPAWFEARYNYGVIAFRLRNYSQALAAYETALAIQPDSVDARYNFALALKGAGYVTDAVNELEKILATNPNEVRAHLALGNIYARQLYDPARARQHYQKVLQLDPGNSQAPDINFWLSSNPG